MTTTASISSKLGVRKITARIGAEVTGVRPRPRAGSPATVTAVRAALNEHKALVFRDVERRRRGPAAFRPLLRRADLGPPDRARGRTASPNVLPVDSEDGSVNYWHTDVTFVLNPPQASTLRSIIVPPYGGETLIANTGGAYRDLPGPLRAFADTLWAVHTNDYDYVGAAGEPRPGRAGAARAVRLDQVRDRPPGGAGAPADRRARPVHRRVRAADRRPVQGRVQGHPAAPAVLRDPAGEHPAGGAGNPASWSCSTTGSPSTTPSTTTTTSPGG